jgi:aryl-alcohol dehydrogenase-like predicted oxidoreductase
MKLTRRNFVRDAALAAGDLAAAGVLAGSIAQAQTPFPTRVLGRTGVRVPLLGFGMAPMGSDSTTPREAARLVNLAIDLGVTYLDVAPIYGSDTQRYGNAESKLKSVLLARRAEVFLVTKVNARRPTRAGVLRQIEESLQRLGTDHLDAVHLHNLGDFDMSQVFTDNGALGGLLEARKRGLLRFIGASGHMRPARFVRAIETGQFDLCMTVLNFADRFTYDFEGTLLPVAQKANVGMVAMKVLGGPVNWTYDVGVSGTLAAYHARTIRYSLGLPDVAAAVIGFTTEDELRQAVTVARAYQPLPQQERAALLEDGRKLAAARGALFGPVAG